MSENSTIQNLGKAGLHKSSTISACSQGKVYQQLPLTVLLGGNTNAVGSSDLSRERGFAPQTPEVSHEVTCLTGPDKYAGNGCSMTRKKRGPDSPGNQGTLTPLNSTGAGS